MRQLSIMYNEVRDAKQLLPRSVCIRFDPDQCVLDKRF